MKAADILRATQSVDRKLISNVTVFDVYEGKGIDPGKKSIAIAVTLQPRDKTMTDQEIDAVAAKIVAEVGKRTGGVLESVTCPPGWAKRRESHDSRARASRRMARRQLRWADIAAPKPVEDGVSAHGHPRASALCTAANPHRQSRRARPSRRRPPELPLATSVPPPRTSETRRSRRRDRPLRESRRAAPGRSGARRSPAATACGRRRRDRPRRRPRSSRARARRSAGPTAETPA